MSAWSGVVVGLRPGIRFC